MNKKWLLLAADMLEMASDKFFNHGCNDWDWPEGWTEADKLEFATVASLANHRGKKTDPEEIEDWSCNMLDWIVMDTLAAELRKEAGK